MPAQANQGWYNNAGIPSAGYAMAQPAVARDSLGIQRYDAVNEISSMPRHEVERLERLIQQASQPRPAFLPTAGVMGGGMPVGYAGYGMPVPAAANPMAMLNQYLASPMTQALLQEVSRNPVVGRYVNSRTLRDGVQTALRDPVLQMVLQIGLQALANEGGGMQAYQPIR